MKHTKTLFTLLVIFSILFNLFTFSCKREVKVGNMQQKEEEKKEEQNETPATKAQIEFFDSDISCTKGGYLGFASTPVASGEEIDVGTELTFTAKVTGTTTIKAWTVNDEVQEKETKTSFHYKVLDTDIQQGKIKIGVERNAGHPILVQFEQNITCYKQSFPLSTKLESGSSVELGDVLTFTGVAQEGKAIDRWAINGNDKAEGKSLKYTVNKDDGKLDGQNLVLKISFSMRELKKLTVHFDVQKVQCNEPGSFISQGKPIANDSIVLEGSKIVFTAKKGKYEDVKTWFINDVEKKSGGDSFTYTVEASDGGVSGIITASWSVSYKIKIEFNKNRITCKKKALIGFLETDVKSGEFHSEGTKLWLYPKLQEGEILKGWYLNGKRYTSLTGLILDNITYDVSNANAKDKDGVRYIEITTQTEFKPRIIIRFEEDKLSCTSNDKPVYNEQGVFEKEKLVFTSKLPEGKAVAKWYVNGKEKTIGTSPKQFEYVVYADQAETEGNKKVMRITIDEKVLQKVKINYNTELVECKGEDENVINTGDAIYEVTQVILTAKIKDSESISYWQVGKKKINKSDKSIHYTVSVLDANNESGTPVIDISYVVKQKIAIKFDPSKITCEVSDGSWFLPKYTSVQNGQLIDVGSFLRFYTVKPNKETFVCWLVNGAEKSGNKDYKKFTYTVDVQDATGGIIKEIEVTVKTK